MLEAFVVLSALLGSPPLETPSRFDAGPRQKITTARDKWQKAGITSYSYTMEHPCHPCPSRKIRVTVRKGKVTSAVLLADYGQLEPNPNPPPLPAEKWQESLAVTIPELFDEAERILKNMRYYSGAIFDDQYGYPRDIFYRIASMEFAGQEGHAGFMVTDFRRDR